MYKIFIEGVKVCDISSAIKANDFFNKFKKSNPDKFVEIKTTSIDEENFYKSLLKRAFLNSFSKKHNNLKEALEDIPNKLICMAREINRIDEIAMCNQGYSQTSGFSFNINKAKEVATRIAS